MEQEVPVCPFCNTAVSLSSFFCQNCGKKLRERPLSTSILRQIFIYLISILLPPYGIWYGIKYLNQNDNNAKAIGIVAIVLTLISLIFLVITAMSLFNTVNQLFKYGQIPQGGNSELDKIINSQLNNYINNQSNQYQNPGF